MTAGVLVGLALAVVVLVGLVVRVAAGRRDDVTRVRVETTEWRGPTRLRGRPTVRVGPKSRNRRSPFRAW